MRKIFSILMALTVLAAFTFVSCDEPSDESKPSDDIKITFDPNYSGAPAAKVYPLRKAGKGTADKPETLDATQLAEITALVTGVNSGNSFQGWFTAKTGGTQLTDLDTNKTWSKSTTYHARWQAQTQASITYAANGWTVGSVSLPATKSNLGLSYTIQATDLPSLAADDSATQHFLGWSLSATGTILTGGESITGAQTLYVRWQNPSLVNANIPVITAHPAGRDYYPDETIVALSVTAVDSFDNDGTGTAAGKGTLTYQWYSATSHTAQGSAIAGATNSTYTPTFSLNTPATYYYYVVVTNTIADNDDGGEKTESVQSNHATINVLSDSYDGTFDVETVALHNGGAVVYKFTIPADTIYDFTAYSTLSFTTQLVYPELQTSGTNTVGRVRMYGPYQPADFITADLTTSAPLNAYVARWDGSGSPGSANNYLHGYMAANLSTTLTTYGWSEDNPGDWFTIEYALTGDDSANSLGNNSPSANTTTTGWPKWPGMGEPANPVTGDFYFAIGLSNASGNAKDVVVSRIKDVKFTPNAEIAPDAPVIYGTIPFEDPAYAGYVTTGWNTDSPVQTMWRDMGDASKSPPVENPAPIYIEYRDNFTDPNDAEASKGGTTFRWIFPGDTAPVPPAEPTAVPGGFKFLGWFTQETGGTQVSTALAYTEKTVLYGHWDIDEDYIVPPTFAEIVEIDNKFYVGDDWNWINSDNQRGLGTRGGGDEGDSFYNNSGTAVVSNLTLADLQNALYLKIDVTEFPNGGGNFDWFYTNGDQAGRKAVFGNPSDTSDGSIADAGVTYVTDGSDKYITIYLPDAIANYTAFQALGKGEDPVDTWVKFYIGYWGGGDTANWTGIGVTGITLYFDEDYDITSEADGD